MAAERAINMALRVLGIGEVERDFKRVGQAGSDAFERVERSANGADRQVTEYTERLRRAVQTAKHAFDTTPGIDTARAADPAGYLAARNQAVLDAVEIEKARISAGLPTATGDFEDLGDAVTGSARSLAVWAGVATGAYLVLNTLKDFVLDSLEAFLEHEKALDAFEAALALTGNRSDATAGQIAGMAAAIRDSTLQTEEGALRAAQALATVPGITTPVMQQALAATAAFADKAGIELPDAIESRTLPVLKALADRDMKALIKATEDLSDGLANTIVQLAAAGDTAGAQQALFEGLRDAAGDGPNGLATASDRLTDAWERTKRSFGEEFAGPAATALNLLADLLDWVGERAAAAGVSWRTFARTVTSAIPLVGPLVAPLLTERRRVPGELPSAASAGFVSGMLGNARQAASNAADRAERLRLEKLYGGSGSGRGRSRGRGGGRSSADREAEQLQREAERARAAADRVIEANQETIASYRERAEEARARIGLEGAALEAFERQLEIEAAVRRINTELIDAEVEARRAAAAAAGQQFDVASATAEATDVVEAQRDAVRGLAEDLADANRDLADFARRQQQAAAIIEQTRTPLEQMNAQIDTAIELLRAGSIDAETFERRMDQLAERIARVTYESDEAAHAWRGFGHEVGRTLTDIALNGGDAIDILRELIRLPLERLLFSEVETPIANWIDRLTGNDPDANTAAARAGLPTADQVLGASVQLLPPAAEGAAASLGTVQIAGQGAAQALAAIPAMLGNPIVDLTGETERATQALAGLDPVAAQFGSTLTQVIASLAGGGGSGGIGGLLQLGLGLAGAATGGSSSLARLVPDVTANIAANPQLFASGTPGVPVNRWFEVGENGRELMRFHGGGRLEVMGSSATRQFASDGGAPIVHQTINVPERADPRRTMATVNRGTQVALARAARKGLAAGPRS